MSRAIQTNGPQRTPPPLADAATGLGDGDDDMESLARELARGYGARIAAYRRTLGLEAAAEEQAQTPREVALALVQQQPPDQISWWALSAVMDHDPAAALTVWQQVCDAARQELHSGHRTALSLEGGNMPWDRARFLALRQAFREEWRPHGGVEAALIDLLAQTFSLYLQWSERLALYAESECRTEDSKLAADGYWLPPRRGEAQWMSWCAEQADRAHRRFLMTLKSLHDLRRLPAVRIAAASQVTIAQQALHVVHADDHRARPDDSAKS